MVIISFIRCKCLNLLQPMPFDKPKYSTPTPRVSERHPWLGRGGQGASPLPPSHHSESLSPKFRLDLLYVTTGQRMSSFTFSPLYYRNCKLLFNFQVLNYNIDYALIISPSTPSSYPPWGQSSDLLALGRNVLQLRTTGRAHLIIFTYCSSTFSLSCYLCLNSLRSFLNHSSP